jgi:hypothetical protein
MELLSEVWKALVEHLLIEVIAAAFIAIFTVFRYGLPGRLTTWLGLPLVSGKWRTILGPGTTDHEDAELHQIIRRVWGKTKTRAGEEYSLSGRITGDRLCVDYYQTTNSGTDCGAILLTIGAGGRKMQGYEIGIDPSTNEVYSRAYEWNKAK